LSAIQNILKLLLIFEDDSRIFNAKELAQEIGVSTRQIRYYIQELRKFGYVIESDASKGGGYKSVGQSVPLPLKITNEELTALAKIKQFFSENKVFEEQEYFNRLYYKLIEPGQLSRREEDCINYKLQYKNVHKEIEKEFLRNIKKSIVQNNKIMIKYYSVNSDKLTNRIIHPYRLQQYQGAFYIHAYCESAKEYRLFKVIRIKELEIIDETFIKKGSIEGIISKQNFGVFTQDRIHLVVDFYHPLNEFIKEIIIGEEQRIIRINSRTTRIEVYVNNETEITSWLLGFGEYVKVIKPQSVINKILENVNKIKEYYSCN